MGRPLNLWLIVVVVICGLSIWFGKGMVLPKVNNVPAPAEKAFVSDFSMQGSIANIYLLILNGTQEKGLASEFSLIVSRIGCIPQGTGNAPAKPWQKSILINRRLSDERARELAGQLGGIPVIREFDGRTSEDAVLVLGEDHQVIRKKLHPRALLGQKND